MLEHGLGNALDVWAQVMDLLAAVTTVCASNRAGLGRSDPRPAPHGASSAVDDMHALLGAAHLPSPYVLVGASFGGCSVSDRAVVCATHDVELIARADSVVSLDTTKSNPLAD